MVTDPWTLLVSGKANKTGKFSFEDVIRELIKKSVSIVLGVLKLGPWSCLG